MTFAKQPIRRPAICLWLKAYCVIMLLLLGVVVAAALVMIFAPHILMADDPTYRRNPAGAAALSACFGVVFAVIFAAPMPPLLAFLFWPRGPRAWYVGLAAIIAGFFTTVGWIATFPLLLYWVRPPVKAYYGVQTASPQKD
ncbi:MAG: hypothetical protein RIC55_32185 [Pirellulaceae bacterium]